MSNLKEGCPGSQEIRSPYPEDVKCFFCGERIEIWSDETETKCPKCGNTVTREMKETCIQWCPAAKECVGAEKYEKIMARLKEQSGE